MEKKSILEDIHALFPINEDKFYFLKGHIHGLGLVQRINNLLISDKVTMHLYLVFSCIFSSPYFSKF